MTALLLLILLGDDYFPLKEGNVWTYRTDSGGEFVSKVVGKEKLGDIECFVVQTESGQTRRKTWLDTDRFHVRILQAASGDRIRKYENPLTILDMASKPGESWEVAGRLDLVAVTERFTNRGQEEIVVFGKKTKAWRVHGELTMAGKLVGTNDAWYAKDIGLVKWTQKSSVDGAEWEISYQLEKFEVKK